MLILCSVTNAEAGTHLVFIVCADKMSLKKVVVLGVQSFRLWSHLPSNRTRPQVTSVHQS